MVNLRTWYSADAYKGYAEPKRCNDVARRHMDPAAEGTQALGESACRFKSVARTSCRDDYAGSSRVCAVALALAKAGINFSSRAPSMSNSTGR